MRARRQTIELPPSRETELERWYHERGERAPHERVYWDGVDITDSVPPDEWPWPWSMYFASGWRPWAHNLEPR